MYVVLPTCMPVHHLSFCFVQEPEKGVKSLELQLQMVVSHHVGAGNQSWVSEIVNALNH